MSFKHIQELLELANRLKDSFENYNIDNIERYLNELIEYNSELYEDEKEKISWLEKNRFTPEPKDRYLFALFSANDKNLKIVKKYYLNKVKRCIENIQQIIERLEGVKNQRAVIKEIVNDEVKPFLKERGFGKKGNVFCKRGRRYTKYIKVYPSTFNTVVDAKFVFEFWIIDELRKVKITMSKIKDPTNLKGVEADRVSSLKEERAKDQSYHFNPYTDMPKEKAKIMEDLEAILNYFERFK